MPPNSPTSNGVHNGQKRRGPEKGTTVQSPLETYLKEINEVSLLTPDEEKELAYKIEQNNSEARDKMTRGNLRLVVNIARSYTGKGLGLQDLIEEGNIGLLRAVEGFDPRRNTRFSTYASYWIKQAIKRALVNTAKTIRIPAYMVELLSKWRRETARLQDEFGRPPTHEEVASSLNLPKKKLAIIKKALRVYNPAPQTGDSDEGNLPLEEMAIDNQPDASDELIKEDMIRRALKLLDKMDPREATVLRMRFGLIEGQDSKTLKEIGEGLGLTRERVRQIESDALGKLNESMDGEDPFSVKTGNSTYDFPAPKFFPSVAPHRKKETLFVVQPVERKSSEILPHDLSIEFLEEEEPENKVDPAVFEQIMLMPGEVTRILHLSETTVRGMCDVGVLQATVVESSGGQKIRKYSAQGILQWLEDRGLPTGALLEACGISQKTDIDSLDAYVHLTTGDVSKLLGKTARTINKLFDAGKIPGYRIPLGHGERRMVLRDVLDFANKEGLSTIRLNEKFPAAHMALFGRKNVSSKLQKHLPQQRKGVDLIVQSENLLDFEAAVTRLQCACLLFEFDAIGKHGIAPHDELQSLRNAKVIDAAVPAVLIGKDEYIVQEYPRYKDFDMLLTGGDFAEHARKICRLLNWKHPGKRKAVTK